MASNSIQRPDKADSMDRALLNQIEEDARVFRSQGLYEQHVAPHTERWGRRYARPAARIIREDGTANPGVIANFHRLRVLVTDCPRSAHNPRNPFNLLYGPRRAERVVLKSCLRTLEAYGHLELLRKYPVPLVGNPILFERDGYRLTLRWFRNIYMAGLLARVVGDRLENGFVAVDIGGAYGNLPSLLHQMRPGSHNILVDLPDQLLLGRYFLTRCFPRARIAGIRELAERKTISRSFIEEFDFILAPPSEYAKFEGGAADLISGVGSLGEMKREFFDYYLNAPVFREAKFLFTVNPVVSKDMFPDCDLTVLDYPIRDRRKLLHFAISPAFEYAYAPATPRNYFFYEHRKRTPFFECIAEI